jgi:hypothetical protein
VGPSTDRREGEIIKKKRGGKLVRLGVVEYLLGGGRVFEGWKIRNSIKSIPKE